MTKYYTGDNFCNKETVFHGFYTRVGGVSTDIYEGLNCGTGSNDAPENVRENRKRVAKEAGVAPSNLLSLYQVHGNEVVTVDAPWAAEARPEADGCVTDQAGIALSILTADCAPVLFYGEKADGAPVIGAAHAGWKGALHGVLGNTIEAMTRLGADKGSIGACVGPCISRASYEVDVNFIAPFLAMHAESERFFHPATREGHAMFDLAGYCAWRLSTEGIGLVTILDKDTYVREEEFFSYRLTTHRSEEDYGRQVSVICIK